MSASPHMATTAANLRLSCVFLHLRSITMLHSSQPKATAARERSVCVLLVCVLDIMRDANVAAPARK